MTAMATEALQVEMEAHHHPQTPSVEQATLAGRHRRGAGAILGVVAGAVEVIQTAREGQEPQVSPTAFHSFPGSETLWSTATSA